MNDRGWSSNDLDVKTVQFGEWLLDEQAGGLMPTAFDYQAVDSAADDGIMADIITNYDTRGLILKAEVMGGMQHMGVRLNDEGVADVRRRLARRKDKRLRGAACRDAVLDWLYMRSEGSEPSSVHEMTGDPRAFFEGDAFSESELESAAAYLWERGLVDGMGVNSRADPLRPHLTTDGVDCVEQYDSSVVQWQRRGDSQVHVQSGEQITTHFHGSVSGQVGIAGGNFQQTQHQGIDGEALSRLLNAVRDAVKELDTAEVPRILTYVDTIEAEAVSEQPDPTIVQGAFARIKELAGKTGSAVLNTAVGALVRGGLAALGIGSP